MRWSDNMRWSCCVYERLVEAEAAASAAGTRALTMLWPPSRVTFPSTTWLPHEHQRVGPGPPPSHVSLHQPCPGSPSPGLVLYPNQKGKSASIQPHGQVLHMPWQWPQTKAHRCWPSSSPRHHSDLESFSDMATARLISLHFHPPTCSGVWNKMRLASHLSWPWLLSQPQEHPVSLGNWWPASPANTTSSRLDSLS